MLDQQVQVPPGTQSTPDNLDNLWRSWPSSAWSAPATLTRQHSAWSTRCDLTSFLEDRQAQRARRTWYAHKKQDGVLSLPCTPTSGSFGRLASPLDVRRLAIHDWLAQSRRGQVPQRGQLPLDTADKETRLPSGALQMS